MVLRSSKLPRKIQRHARAGAFLRDPRDSEFEIYQFLRLSSQSIDEAGGGSRAIGDARVQETSRSDASHIRGAPEREEGSIDELGTECCST